MSDLRTELLRLRRRDQETRARLAAGGELFDGYAGEMERIHLANADRLERILDEVGWPPRSEVGDDGTEAAWLVAQHAISRPPFQRRCHRLLAEAVLAHRRGIGDERPPASHRSRQAEIAAWAREVGWLAPEG